jgi:hypothetical protein
VMWLSRSRVNTSMLAHTIKATISPLMHAVSQQMQRLVEISVSMMDRTNITPSGTADEEEVLRVAAALSLGLGSGCGKTKQDSEIEASSDAAVCSLRGLGTSHLWGEIMSMCWVSKGGSTMGLSQSTLTGSSKLFSGDHLSHMICTPTGGVSQQPIKYSVSKSQAASTNSLMRAYQTAITLHQREGTSTLRRGLEQVEIISKAGQVSGALIPGIVPSCRVDICALGRS